MGTESLIAPMSTDRHPEHKQCSRCRQVKPISAFVGPRKNPCKSCLAVTQKKWRLLNREIINAKRRRRVKNDPMSKMRMALRTRQRQIFASLKTQRTGSFVRDMGCDCESFRRYIAKLLTPPMTLDNYGSVWHLDHIYPLSQANLLDRVEFLAVCNYRNIQPLLISENIAKNCSVTPKARALFLRLCRMFRKELHHQGESDEQARLDKDSARGGMDHRGQECHGHGSRGQH